MKGPVINAFFLSTLTVLVLTVTSSDSPSKVTVNVELAGTGEQPVTGCIDTKETGTLSSSLSSSPPHPTTKRTTSKTAKILNKVEVLPQQA